MGRTQNSRFVGNIDGKAIVAVRSWCGESHACVISAMLYSVHPSAALKTSYSNFFPVAFHSRYFF